MTRLTPQLTSLKTLNITYQTPQETLLSTPDTLPTSEPTDPQISYTVAEADLPTLNIGVYKKVYVAYLVAAGRCPTAATVYYRMLKNGTSVYTGSGSVSAGSYYTRMFFFYDVAVGDVLDIKLWSSVADSYWDYKAYQIQVTRIIPMNKPRLLAPCNFKAVETHPALTLGNPTYAPYYMNIYHIDNRLCTLTSPTNFESLYPKDTSGLFRINYGDYANLNQSAHQTSTTLRPYNYRNYVPTQIQMRGVKTD